MHNAFIIHEPKGITFFLSHWSIKECICNVYITHEPNNLITHEPNNLFKVIDRSIKKCIILPVGVSRSYCQDHLTTHANVI